MGVVSLFYRTLLLEIVALKMTWYGSYIALSLEGGISLIIYRILRWMIIRFQQGESKGNAVCMVSGKVKK